MIICRKDHENIMFDITFAKPIPISEHRKIRKILEMTSRNLFLISDAGFAYGLGHIINEYNPIAEDLFTIYFTGHYAWELLHDDKHIINVKYTNPFLPTIEFQRSNFSSDIKRIFKNIEEDEIVKLYTLVCSMLKCKHGTILVICSDAKDEAERLGNQSIQLKPFNIDENTVKKLSNIDGAILIDEHGVCYSIGTILDGIATNKGDSSRGSRYNSSIRYYEQRKKYADIVVIIVSEDGMVDFIPQLMPVISHESINKTIAKLFELESETEINIKKYYSCMDSLYELEFYLTQDQCDQINTYRKRIEPRIAQQNNGVMSREDLYPNSECNATYFSDEDNNQRPFV
jgi:DNA integrity scanning protein DisA with diadenylate cyclase activity